MTRFASEKIMAIIIMCSICFPQVTLRAIAAGCMVIRRSPEGHQSQGVILTCRRRRPAKSGHEFGYVGGGASDMCIAMVCQHFSRPAKARGNLGRMWEIGAPTWSHLCHRKLFGLTDFWPVRAPDPGPSLWSPSQVQVVAHAWSRRPQVSTKYMDMSLHLVAAWTGQGRRAVGVAPFLLAPQDLSLAWSSAVPKKKGTTRAGEAHRTVLSLTTTLSHSCCARPPACARQGRRGGTFTTDTASPALFFPVCYASGVFRAQRFKNMAM